MIHGAGNHKIRTVMSVKAVNNVVHVLSIALGLAQSNT